MYKLNECQFKDKLIESQSLAMDVNSGLLFFPFHTHDISLTSVQSK